MDEFDSIQHHHGVDDIKTSKLFTQIDNKIIALSESIKDTNTKLIVVFDHGLINVTKESEIRVEDIPDLADCLTIPITGESRVRNCFVRPRKVEEFEKIIADKISTYCWCFKGE